MSWTRKEEKGIWKDPPPMPPHITEKSLQEVLSGTLLNIATL